MYDRDKLARLIGRNIRALRGSLTQKDFAENVGINQGPLSRYEAGREIPGIQVLQKIAAGCSNKTRTITVGMLIEGEIKADTPIPAASKPVKPAPKPKAVKKPVDRVARYHALAAAKLAALDAPDVVKPKPKRSKKAEAPVEVIPDEDGGL